MSGDRHADAVGHGAVLYDTRPPERRECCSEGGRCLWHVTEVFEETESGDILYHIWDGTATVDKWIREDDLLYDGMFEPAGWRFPVGLKPTYFLTREIGVHDNHDLMLKANR